MSFCGNTKLKTKIARDEILAIFLLYNRIVNILED